MKVLADSSEGASNNWAVLRAEAPTDAMQQADAALRVELDAEDAAAAPGNWSVLRSQVSTDTMRIRGVGPTNVSEVLSSDLKPSAANVAKRDGLEEESSMRLSSALKRLEDLKVDGKLPVTDEVFAAVDEMKAAKADFVQAGLGLQQKGFDVVDVAKQRRLKEVLADSSEGASNNWAVFRAEAPPAAMEQGDAALRVELDTEDDAAAAAKWSVFSSQASTEAMRKLDDATNAALTPRDAFAVKNPEDIERSVNKQLGARVAFAWAKLSARILAVPQRVIVAAAEAAKERRVKSVLADSSEGVSNNWAVFRAEAPPAATQQASEGLSTNNWAVFRAEAPKTKTGRDLDVAFEDAAENLQKKFGAAAVSSGRGRIVPTSTPTSFRHIETQRQEGALRRLALNLRPTR